jgi:hypothetical protein
MLKLLSLTLKCTLILSALSLFSGSDIFISLIVAQALFILAIDFFGRGDEAGTLIVDNIQKHILRQKHSERAAGLSVLVFCLAVGTVMFLVLPSFSSDCIMIPDLTGIRPFSAEANYMSLEGYVASYCLSRGRAISRGEARKLVKEALKSRGAAISKPCASVVKTYTVNDCGCRAADCRHNISVKYVNNARNLSVVPVNCQAACVSDCATGCPAATAVVNCRPDCSCSACVQPLTIERYDRMLKTYRSRSANTISVRPGRLTYGRGRVAVLPFTNKSGRDEASSRVYKAVADEFKNKGYSVIDISRVTNLISNPEGLSEYELARIAQCLEADMIVCGEIKRYSRYKKVRLAGLILGGIVSGVHNYGDVELSTKVFKASECAVIYDNVISERRKNQTFGMFQGTGSVMNYSLAKAVENLYRKF